MPNSVATSETVKSRLAACGSVDPITGAVCGLHGKHLVHKDRTGGLEMTWKDVKLLIVVEHNPSG